jgi:hypothetical protein
MATIPRPLVLALAGLVFSGSLFAQTALYTLPPPLELNNVTSNSNDVFGTKFNVSGMTYANGIDVLSLGAFDFDFNGESASLNHVGFVADQSVKLWSDTGTLLASATLSAASGASNDFVYAAITPVHLAPGDYVLSVYSNTAGAYRDGRLVFQDFIMATGFTVVARLNSFNAGDVFPTQDSGPATIYNGANLTFSATPAVPEPATVALLAGLVSLALAAACRRGR